MTPEQIDETITLLNRRYPRADIIPTTLPIDHDNFVKQKIKQQKHRSCAAAIGVVTTPYHNVILARRSTLHAGWSLPGGTVEPGEEFEATFRREINEEVGVPLEIVDLMIINSVTFVSPNNEKLRFLLTVFAATTSVSELPSPTVWAAEEGLEMQLYQFDSLPDMILQDRAKVDHFHQNWCVRHKWPNEQTNKKESTPWQISTR